MTNLLPVLGAANPYLYVLIFGGCAAFLALFLWIAPSYLAGKRALYDKCAPYECGIAVQPKIEMAKFDVRFYVVAMLFLIFDCEIVFLFPWSIVTRSQSVASFMSILVFLAILGVSLVYEWRKKVLDW